MPWVLVFASCLSKGGGGGFQVPSPGACAPAVNCCTDPHFCPVGVACICTAHSFAAGRTCCVRLAAWAPGVVRHPLDPLLLSGSGAVAARKYSRELQTGRGGRPPLHRGVTQGGQYNLFHQHRACRFWSCVFNIKKHFVFVFLTKKKTKTCTSCLALTGRSYHICTCTPCTSRPDLLKQERTAVTCVVGRHLVPCVNAALTSYAGTDFMFWLPDSVLASY